MPTTNGPSSASWRPEATSSASMPAMITEV